MMDCWIQPYGYPKVLRCDRGLHNRGILQNELTSAGVQVSNCGLEAPCQIEKVERAGELWENLRRKVIIARHVCGYEDIKLLASEVNATNNDIAKVRSFSPNQWALGRQPRRGNGDQFDSEGFADIGSIQERYDGTT